MDNSNILINVEVFMRLSVGIGEDLTQRREERQDLGQEKQSLISKLAWVQADAAMPHPYENLFLGDCFSLAHF